MLLSKMVDNKESCHWNHPLVRAMRLLQKRYNGVFPSHLQSLWKLVRLPTEPNAAITYHDGIPRLKLWFEDNFNFNEEMLDDSDKPKQRDCHSADEWFNSISGSNSLEKGMGASEESVG